MNHYLALKRKYPRTLSEAFSCDAMSDKLKLQIRRVYANDEMLSQLEAGIKKFNDDVEATINEMNN